MKKKTYLKQGTYQKVDNNRGTDIKGALNFNKEVLDTLVDKTLAGTVDCCLYYPVIPVIDVVEAQTPTADETSNVPCNGLFISRTGTILYVWVKDCINGSNIGLGDND